ncbi:hypothetical protein [Gimesia panareensis]|uniref:Secreted protein n=1 Tax=Gimesia panareensis TaxID=2527978 RepID=A0A518AGC0_9PLAN|nr:hypothetical protein [Gimesia panareensis]QDT30732.1 hypothetical protein Enr10x_61000 [Gimesia panareensis]QDU53781.1 hypothetical protein Pan110_61750 [Gimesia panareensis]QDV21681.1 hypothetical protein Pan153_63710 [Gimesia panareensis]
MLIRIACLMSLFLTGFAVADTCDPVPAAGPRFVSVKLCQQEPAKVLAECTVQTTAAGKFDSRSGGTLPVVQGAPALSVGVRAAGTITPADRQQFHVALQLQVGNRVSSGSAKTQVVRTETVEIRSLLQTGKTKRFPCGAGQLLELRLE